jgi:hypothetical protein
MVKNMVSRMDRFTNSWLKLDLISGCLKTKRKKMNVVFS